MAHTAPQGHYLSSVKVGAKGQIVIPKEARDMFNIQPGDTLLLIADEKKGIAIHRYEVLRKILEKAGVPLIAFENDPGSEDRDKMEE